MTAVPTATTHPGLILSVIDRLARLCSGLTGSRNPGKRTSSIARQRDGGRVLGHPVATLAAPISP